MVGAKTTTEEEPMWEVERHDELNDETHCSTPQSPSLPAKSSAAKLCREAGMGPDTWLPHIFVVRNLNALLEFT
jgi:hypothetical protein